MIERGLRLALKFRDNALSQHFAEFDSPLVERVNIPNHPLGENRVLVKGNQLAKIFRREALGEIVVKTLSDYAPEVHSSIIARKVITPLDLEETYAWGWEELARIEGEMQTIAAELSYHYGPEDVTIEQLGGAIGSEIDDGDDFLVW